MDESFFFTGTSSGARYVAAVLDNILALIFSFIVTLTIKDFLGYKMQDINLAIIAFFYLLYYFLQEAYWSKTIGKKITNLEITNKENKPINWKQALIRTILRLFEANIVVGFLPAILLIIFTKRKQRLGDLLAKTVVNYQYD